MWTSPEDDVDETDDDEHDDRDLRAQPSMLSSTFVETVKLMQIGSRIMSAL
jgi:hypothetical protein